MHYVPPPPPKKQVHVSFASLVKSGTNWGKKQPEGEWGEPTDNDLIIGYLARIANTLDSVLVELQRPRRIS